MSSRTDRAREWLLGLTAIVVGAGCYGGNGIIAAGQGLLVILILSLSFSTSRQSKHSWNVPLSSWALITLIVVNLVSILVNLDSFEHPFRDAKKVRYLALPLLVLIIPKVREYVKENWKKVTVFAGLSFLIVACSVTLSDMLYLKIGFHPLLPQVEDFRPQRRLGGIFGSVMTYAYSMQVSLLVMIGAFISWWVLKSSYPRWILFFLTGSLVICVLGFVLSGSRGALLGFFVGVAVLATQISRKLVIFGGVLALIVVLAVGLTRPGIHLLGPRGNDSVRVSQWKTAFVTGLKNPFFGIGYRQFEKQCRDLKKEYGFPHDLKFDYGEGKVETRYLQGNAHSNYFEALASTGFLGLSCLLGFFFFWIKEVWRNRKTRILFAPAIIGFVVSGFFENSFTDGEIISMLMLFYVGSQLMLSQEEDAIPEQSAIGV